MLHIELQGESTALPPSNPTSISNSSSTTLPHSVSNSSSTPLPSHAAVGISSNLLLMTCDILVVSPTGASRRARALLDGGSSVSFVSERLVRSLRSPCTSQDAYISGVAGLTRSSSNQSIADFSVCSTHPPPRTIGVSAVVVPRVTCDLPLHLVPFDSKWNHLNDVRLADPSFGRPGRIDLLLGVEIFTTVLRQGRRMGPPGSPVALETEFGWVLAGNTGSSSPASHAVVHHATLLSGDDILRKFWEIEKKTHD